jgi:hypothetical protein
VLPGLLPADAVVQENSRACRGSSPPLHLRRRGFELPMTIQTLALLTPPLMNFCRTFQAGRKWRPFTSSYGVLIYSFRLIHDALSAGERIVN